MFERVFILSLLLSVAVVFGGPIETFAQVEEATVKVDGLSCPFCAYGLEKRIKKVEGVEKLEINVNDGAARITGSFHRSVRSITLAPRCSEP